MAPEGCNSEKQKGPPMLIFTELHQLEILKLGPELHQIVKLSGGLGRTVLVFRFFKISGEMNPQKYQKPSEFQPFLAQSRQTACLGGRVSGGA